MAAYSIALEKKFRVLNKARVTLSAAGWQIIDRLVAERPAEDGVGGLQQGERAGDGDLLALRAGRERQVHTNVPSTSSKIPERS